MSLGVLDAAGYDVLTSTLSDLFTLPADRSIEDDRPRIEEELILLAEQYGVYLLILEYPNGEFNLGIVRESPSPRAVIGQVDDSGRRLGSVKRLG